MHARRSMYMWDGRRAPPFFSPRSLISYATIHSFMGSRPRCSPGKKEGGGKGIMILFSSGRMGGKGNAAAGRSCTSDPWRRRSITAAVSLHPSNLVHLFVPPPSLLGLGFSRCQHDLCILLLPHEIHNSPSLSCQCTTNIHPPSSIISLSLFPP